ncbi:sensor histidine kinase [Nocardia harenae]|uniref:sensor histidine kinase n=1 Tax=Nocardia harenae TaxID=358707 RepID=UPI0008339FEF|nr:sensor histidine kinase [Nocardia harenae]
MNGASASGIDAVPASSSSNWYRLWTGFVVVGCVAACVVVVLLHRQTPAERLGSCAALTGIVAWTLALGCEHVSGPGVPFSSRTMNSRTAGFTLGLLILFATAVYLSCPAVTVLPVVYALIYLTLPLRAAVPTGSAASVLVAVAAIASQGPDGPEVPLALAISLVGFLVSPMIGAAVTVAVERGEQQAVLLDQLAQSRAETARLSRVAGRSDERARLAREIHDTLAQGFTSIVTLAQAVESEIDQNPAAAHRHIGLITETARENLAEARSMVAELTPSTLRAGSLVDSVRRQADRLADGTDIAVTVTACDPFPALTTAGEVVLLRVAQEAFANVRKHAGASTVTVRMLRTGTGVRLSVTDDGAGFAPDRRSTGFGLRGMRERAEQAGGTVSVSSWPGRGTTVEVEIPA